MFFTLLLILWLVFLGLMVLEMKLFKQTAVADLEKKYTPIRWGIVLLSGIFAIVYGWNLSGNINVQNIVMTTLMLVTVVLSIFVVPKRVMIKDSKNLAGWMIFRNVVAIFNAITILVHFIIFVVLR